jgi:hypothetical protein
MIFRKGAKRCSLVSGDMFNHASRAPAECFSFVSGDDRASRIVAERFSFSSGDMFNQASRRGAERFSLSSGDDIPFS